MTKQLGALLVLAAASAAHAQDPFADEVVEYVPGDNLPTVFGSNPPIPFDNDEASLGEPARNGAFGPIGPFSPQSSVDEIVSIGEGGSLTVRFDEPVTNAPNNPFGIDLLVFGNEFLGFSGEFPGDETTTVTGVGVEGGIIQVSNDGVNFVTVPDVAADGAFPTLAFSDVTTPFPSEAFAPSDFTLPVDPSIDLVGLTTTELVEAYNGSAGGAGVDIGAVGFEEISFVRILNPIGSGVTPEIDGFADVRAVPEPSALAIALAGLGLLARRRRQR